MSSSVLLKRPVKSVIFDLDGVLLDTEPIYTAAAEEVIARYGKSYPWDIKKQTMGRDPRFGAELLTRTLNLPLTAEEYLAERGQLLEKSLPSAAAIPGAPEFVQSLSDRGVPIAVATSSDRALFGVKTSAHAWFSQFSVIVCGDDGIAQYKPEPDIFLTAAKMLGTAAEECLVFEDSIAGIKAALSAGMQVIAIPDPRQEAEHFKGAAHRIKDYRELSVDALGLG